MKNKKKNHSKNRIKRFFIEPGKHGINRVKEDEENSGLQEGGQDFQNPEELGETFPDEKTP